MNAAPSESFCEEVTVDAISLTETLQGSSQFTNSSEQIQVRPSAQLQKGASTSIAVMVLSHSSHNEFSQLNYLMCTSSNSVCIMQILTTFYELQ